MIRGFCASVFCVLLFSILIFAESAAQSNWVKEDLRNYIQFEYYKAKFDSDFLQDLSGYTAFVSIKKSINDELSVKVDLPFARTKYERYDYWTDSDEEIDYRIIGNPYIGVETFKKDPNVMGEMGFRFPFNEDSYKGAIGGGFSNYDDFDAFQKHYLSFKGKFNFIFESEFLRGLYLRIGFGPKVLIPVRKEGYMETEMFGMFGFDFLFRQKLFDICMGLNGTTHVTADKNENGSTELLIGIGPNIRFEDGNFGVRFNFPADGELDGIIDFAFLFYFQLRI